MIDPASLSPWLLLVAPVVIVVAYTVFGLSGFGATAISVPILAHFLPVSYLVPLVALLDMVSSSLIGIRHREQVSKEELKRLLMCEEAVKRENAANLEKAKNQVEVARQLVAVAQAIEASPYAKELLRLQMLADMGAGGKIIVMDSKNPDAGTALQGAGPK